MPALPSVIGTKSRSSCEAVSYRRMLTRQGYRRVDHARDSRPIGGSSGGGEHDRRGDGGNALAAAGEPETVRGRRRDRHRCGHYGAQHGLGLFTAWTEARAVADDLDGDVADGKAGNGHDPRSLRKQLDTRDAGELGAVGAEVGAKVSESGSGEEGVARGVGCDVAVGVPGQPALTGPGEPGQGQRAVVVGIGVDVHANPDTWRGNGLGAKVGEGSRAI